MLLNQQINATATSHIQHHVHHCMHAVRLLSITGSTTPVCTSTESLKHLDYTLNSNAYII